jgi:hypothetical protein
MSQESSMHKTLLLLISVMCLTNTYAGFFIEPYFGIGKGSSDGVLINQNSTDTFNPSSGGRGEDDELTYTDMGLRIGGYFPGSGIHLGGNINWVKGKSNRSNTNKKEFQTLEIGPFIGWDISVIPLRFYGSPVVSFKYLKLNNTHTESDTDQESGSSVRISVSESDLSLLGIGARLGASFTLLPLVTINAEYRTVNYTTYSFGSLSNDLDIEISEKSFLTSISIMFGEN